ncbi:uncharacterized protein PG986_005893 [Apiospora aurea]|uniref:Uncharacterized protein n=1 Tax=Apiospora aurea TaxID=335848 RepID=A0ABR1QIW6_9PEZI
MRLRTGHSFVNLYFAGFGIITAPITLDNGPRTPRPIPRVSLPQRLHRPPVGGSIGVGVKGLAARHGLGAPEGGQAQVLGRVGVAHQDARGEVEQLVRLDALEQSSCCIRRLPAHLVHQEVLRVPQAALLQRQDEGCHVAVVALVVDSPEASPVHGWSGSGRAGVRSADPVAQREVPLDEVPDHRDVALAHGGALQRAEAAHARGPVVARRAALDQRLDHLRHARARRQVQHRGPVAPDRRGPWRNGPPAAEA